MKFQKRILISISVGMFMGVSAFVADLFLPEIFHFEGCVPAGFSAVMVGNLAQMPANLKSRPWWLLVFWGFLASLLAFMLAMLFLNVLALPPVPSWAAIDGLMAAIGCYVGSGHEQTATEKHTGE